MLLNLLLLCFHFFAKSVLSRSNLIDIWCYRRNSAGVFWEAECSADLYENRKSARQFCWVRNHFVCNVFLSICSKNSFGPFDLGWEVTETVWISEFVLFRNAWLRTPQNTLYALFFQVPIYCCVWCFSVIHSRRWVFNLFSRIWNMCCALWNKEQSAKIIDVLQNWAFQFWE